MRTKKFVLDNNIWISHLITKSDRLLKVIEKYDLVVFSCDELIEELRDVLTRPHVAKYGVNIAEALRIHGKATMKIQLTHPIKRYIPADKDDDFLIALALQTGSGFITSGDTHILDEKDNLERKFKKLKILTKAEFEQMFPI